MKQLVKRGALLALVLVLGALVLYAKPALAAYITNPPGTVTRNGGVVTIRKELSGYENYGAEGLADVLYSNETAGWGFDLAAAGVAPESVNIAEVRAGLVLDDHYDRPATEYVGAVHVNSNILFEGSFTGLGMQHGAPFGEQFTNWQTFSRLVTAPPTGTDWNVIIANNTEGAVGGDWIAIDWIELRLTLANDRDFDGVIDNLDECPVVAGHPDYRGCPIKRFDIMMMTFIPSNYIDASVASRLAPVQLPRQLWVPGTWCTRAATQYVLIGAGDNRGYNPVAANSPAKPYKTLQKASLVVIDKFTHKEYELENEQINIGRSRSYVKTQFGNGGALNNGVQGRIDPQDNDTTLNDCRLLHQNEQSPTTGIELPANTHVSPTRERVVLKGRSANALVPFSPSIDWNINVDIETATPTPRVYVHGTKDQFPAYEIYVNNQPVYRFAPTGLSPSELPVTMFGAADLLGLSQLANWPIQPTETVLSN
jgi:hypothetical protein